MKVTTVSIREFESRLSHYMRLAKAGETVEITERVVPIGRIVPTSLPAEDRVQLLARSGLLAWNRRKLSPRLPSARVRGKKTVAEVAGRGQPESGSSSRVNIPASVPGAGLRVDRSGGLCRSSAPVRVLPVPAAQEGRTRSD